MKKFVCVHNGHPDLLPYTTTNATVSLYGLLQHWDPVLVRKAYSRIIAHSQK